MNCRSASELADVFFCSNPYCLPLQLHDALYVAFGDTRGLCPVEHHEGAALFVRAIKARNAANLAIV